MLVLKRDRGIRWRGASRISLREHESVLEADPPRNYVDVVDLTLASDAAQSLEAAITQWVEEDYLFRLELPECDVVCLLHVWVPTLDVSHLVIQPRLTLDAIRYERRADLALLGH